MDERARRLLERKKFANDRSPGEVRLKFYVEPAQVIVAGG
jgi:hypothetical protein